MESRRDAFQAIADPTRREIIGLLAHRPQPVNAIANHFDMSRQAISLHVKILQECGLISILQEGRERTCSLQPEKLAEVARWLEQFRQIWESRFNQLDQLIVHLKANKDENQPINEF